MVRTTASDLLSETLRGLARDPRREDDLGHLDRNRRGSWTQEVTIVDVPVDDTEDLSVPRHLSILPFVDLFESFEPSRLQAIFMLEMVDQDSDRPIPVHPESKNLPDDDQSPVVDPISTEVSFDHSISPYSVFCVLMNHLAKARCKFILNDIL